MNVENSNFTGNTGIEYGGAIYIDSTAPLTIKNCRFEDNEAKYGGAISMIGYAEIINSQFINNTADMAGGAIDTDHATIDNCEFAGNHARNGSAVLIWNDTSIKNSKFTRNTAAKYGGAVYGDDDELVIIITIENTTFEDNFAMWGGAVLSSYELNVVNSNFNNNTATSSGGALHGIELTVENSNFNNNSVAEGNGGAISGINVTVENSNFTNNNAIESGGAIYTLGAIVRNSYFSKNNITYDGGAIFINSYNSTIENTTFNTNNAGRYGGAIYISKNELKVEKSTFTDNTAPDESYNIYINNEATIITNNTNPEKLIISGFNSLVNKINAFTDDILVLSEDYLFNPTSDTNYVNGVEITQDNLTIDGQNHTIDSANQARIFNVLAFNVTIRNINFINGNTSFGGASRRNATVKNSIFVCNCAEYGGAIYMGNYTVTIENSTFENNTAIDKSYNVYVANESKLVSENNTPKNILPASFKSLAELINNCEGNTLVLDSDYWYNPNTDSELTD